MNIIYWTQLIFVIIYFFWRYYDELNEVFQSTAVTKVTVN